MGTGSCWPHTHPSLSHLPGSFSQGHQVLVVAECQASGRIVGREWQSGSPLPQVEFYASRAEAYIQLCDFSSAAQNLRKAYSSQPENTNFLERLTLVLYLKVPGAAPGPQGPTSHPGLLTLPPALGGFPCS